MSCKSLIKVVNTASTTVVAGGTLRLATIVRRYGCALNQSGNSVVINKPGYYRVSINATFTAPVAGVVTLTLNQNGSAVTGATASTTITTATTEVRNLSFSDEVRVVCGSAPSTLSIVDTGVDATFSNITLIVNEDI